MKKRYGILASAALVGALCLCALPCAGKGEADASPQSLYAGRTQDANVLIDIPNLRQYGGYTCGTTCVQMLMNWLEPYQADLNLTAYEEALGTTEEAGTSPDAILAFFEENDVRVIAREKRTTDDLIAALDRGHPVLVCIQAWGADGYNTQDPSDADTYLAEGHWVICVGYQKKIDGNVFYFNDPACVGYGPDAGGGLQPPLD